MEKIILFIKIIAWVIAPISTIFAGICLYLGFKYPGSIDETLDKLKGVSRTYPAVRWLIIALISWAFFLNYASRSLS